MVHTAPTDPYLRKIMLPSIIRISDIMDENRRSGFMRSGMEKSQPKKQTIRYSVSNGQLKLEL